MDPAVGSASDAAMEIIEGLAGEIGPRRPCGAAEREAARLLASELTTRGLRVRTEVFRSQSTFVLPYAAIFGLALGAGLLPRRRRMMRSVIAASASILAALDGEFHPASPLRALARGGSANVIAEVPASESADRTLCLVSHMDSSRSGLMFHPSVTPHLSALAGATGVVLAVQGLEPLLGRNRPGRCLLRASRAMVALAAGLFLEREVRGADVPGANDNASGAAACVVLGGECGASPLRRTRVVVLITGSEESGVVGAQSFLEGHDTSGWLFLNFDGVGAPASLHYLLREGGALRSWDADPGLVGVAESVSKRHPDLGLTGTKRSSGLPYDSTPVLARGGRAITLTVQNGSIPNYHWPTDTADRIDRDVLGRALGAGREMIAAIDRGEADL